jgi:glutaredoxin
LSVEAARVRLLGMNITSLRSWVAIATLLLSALPAHALFKVVGPDGKVTYSDRPPPGDTRAVQVNRDGSIASNDVALPFALRQVMAKFPVTLYTASKCEACEMGRALLQRRGIPFSERTATTNEDKEVWEKITGGQEAPMMKVGAQVMRGFNATSWEETLDVAGYSRQSQLPPNYKAAAAQPLVEPKPVKPPPTAADTTPTPAPVDQRSNPVGIRF